MTLRAVPVTLARANAFVARAHRHHPPVVGHRFSVGAMAPHGLCGVAIVGHPIARTLDQRRIVEVNRLCTDGFRMACSFLYGVSARAAAALGYYAIVTYTLDEEGGASLRGAGWWGELVEGSARTWHTPSDPSRTGGLAKPKWRWVRFLSEWPETLPEDVPTESPQGLLFAPQGGVK